MVLEKEEVIGNLKKVYCRYELTNYDNKNMKDVTVKITVREKKRKLNPICINCAEILSRKTVVLYEKNSLKKFTDYEEIGYDFD